MAEPETDRPAGGPDRPARGPAHRRPDPAARRLTRVLAGIVVAIAVLGVGLRVVSGAAGEPSAASPPTGPALPATPPAATAATTSVGAAEVAEVVALPPLPAVARAPEEQLRVTIGDLEELVQRDPGGAGPRAGEVLDGLRRVEVLGGGAQRAAAVVVHDAAVAAVTDGGLAPAVGQRVQQVLSGVVRPARLIDLEQTVAADPPAVGPAGPELVDAFRALDHDVPAGETADRAADLLADVRDAAARGELSGVFADAAVPTLEQLADPEPHRALEALLAEAERDPDAIGPARDEVLASLRAIAELPVWPQGNEVGELLDLIRRDGEVTPAFRDAAVPVLVPVLR
ncbi:hypothetical protein [Geodermatophilus sp. SYSU D01176]